MSTTNISTHVSPTIRPENITGLPGYNEQTKGYVSSSVNALKIATTAIDDTIKARLAVNADPSRNPKAKVLAVADYAEKQDSQLQKLFEKTADDLLKRIAHKESELSKPVEEFAGIGHVASEIRNHLKNTDRDKRMAFLNEALESGDDKTLKSILGAPSYLSGLTDLEHKHYTKLFHQKANPEIAAQINLMSGALDKLKNAHKVIRKQFDEAIGANAVEVAKLRAANSAAEEALAVKNLLGMEE
ncbi:hypothetical protein WKI13_18930 [Teredinibacter turnerae]|uniref:hypothetical protein n=1 Tax=Teredinibacter turnerae TaxID=2426 RepID=UPI00036BBE2E|nr:hypothetical protein [Teredinibacter turnerae]